MEAVALKQLETRLHEPLTVQERVRLLNEMSEQLYERDPTRGAQLAREAIELARATGDVPGEAQGLYCLGRNLYCQADYPLVFETQAAANALFRTLGDTHGQARCANLLGITHRQLSDYSRALEMYEAALRGFRETNDLRWQARIISNIGNVEIQLGNFNTALELFEQALELRRQCGDNEGAGFDLNNAAFGHVQRALQLRSAGELEGCQVQAEKALALLEGALRIARQYGYRRLEAFCVQTMGEAYQAMARPQVALEMADAFLEIAHASNDRWIEAYGLACIGDLRHAVGQHDAALIALRKALGTFESLGARDQVARVLRAMSQAHEAVGQLPQALACLRRAGSIEQHLRSEETESRARAIAARRRLDQLKIESERYRRLAMEDALTGLANRRQLDERLATLIRDAKKSGTLVTVALADVDHFKGINDRFSHAVGDEVLRCVGEILRGFCRLGDLAGRYGGEEFVLVFRAMDLRAAAEICERVRRRVEHYDWSSIHPHLRVTLSIGLATSGSFEEPDALLDTADHWLYEAKHRGRNQVQPVVPIGAGTA